MLTRGIGIGLIAIGLALTYNFFAPASRLGGHRFDALMFFGPAILVFGILLASGLKAGVPPRGIGVGLIAIGLPLTYTFGGVAIALGGHLDVFSMMQYVLLFFGLGILVFGVLLASGLKVGVPADSANAIALYFGLVFVAIPLSLLAFSTFNSANVLSRDVGFLSVILAPLLGLPGLALLVVYGIARARRARR